MCIDLDLLSQQNMHMFSIFSGRKTSLRIIGLSTFVRNKYSTKINIGSIMSFGSALLSSAAAVS